MSENGKSVDTEAYERAVLALVRQYGSAMEVFGIASTGSPGGMERTMRLAEEAARELLHAALGREPTLEDLEKVPPLQELPIVNVAVKDIVSEEEPDDEDSVH